MFEKSSSLHSLVVVIVYKHLQIANDTRMRDLAAAFSPILSVAGDVTDIIQSSELFNLYKIYSLDMSKAS